MSEIIIKNVSKRFNKQLILHKAIAKIRSFWEILAK